jgi:hypothetical protein
LRPASEAVRLAAWFTSSLTTPIALGCLALAGLLFPDGHLPSHRSRWVAVLIVAAAVLFAGATGLDPVGLVWYPTIANPFAAPASLAPAFDAARAVTAMLVLVALGAMVAAVIRRYRSGDVIVRAQLRWIMLAVALGGLLSVPFIITRYVITVSDAMGQVFAATVFVGIGAIPVAAAFAITRHRLFGIDRLISRTLVYLPLVGILGGLYAAGVTLFQRLFVAITGEPSDAPFLIAVFLIAGAFTPVRKGMEGTVDRWVRAGQQPASAEGVATSPGSSVVEERPSSTIAVGEPISMLPRSAPQAAGDDGGGARSAATVAAVRRLEALLTGGGVSAASDRTEAILPIRADAAVDCPVGSAVPFTSCLGCPYLAGVGTSPPEIRCWRPGAGQVGPA